MAWQIVVTDAWNFKDEVVDFGDDKQTAQRVFSQTWNGLLRDGFVSVHSASNERFIQYNKGDETFFVELRERQPIDLDNLFGCIKMLALAKSNPNMGWIWAVCAAEDNQRKLKVARHHIKIDENGLQSVLPLDDDRGEAIRQFVNMVSNAGYHGGSTWRCVDKLMKYTVVSGVGTTTLEFVEGGA